VCPKLDSHDGNKRSANQNAGAINCCIIAARFMWVHIPLNGFHCRIGVLVVMFRDVFKKN